MSIDLKSSSPLSAPDEERAKSERLGVRQCGEMCAEEVERGKRNEVGVRIWMLGGWYERFRVVGSA